MTTPRFAFAFAAAAIAAVAACSTDDRRVPSDTGTPLGGMCTTADTCVTSSCLRFRANKQGTQGMCTKSCVTNLDCPSGAGCITTNLGSFCFPLCSTTAQCQSGFVCTSGEGFQRFCGVEPATNADAGVCNDDVRGSCYWPEKRECKERAGDPKELANDVAACNADPSAIWSDGPCPILDNIGGCRTGCDLQQTTWFYKPSETGQVGKFKTEEEVKASCASSGAAFVKL